MDGGLTAVADVARAMSLADSAGDYRLIGGIAVMLHIARLGLDLPLRATGDADFGTPPYALRRPELVEALNSLGYEKVLGNRWERRIDARRVATVDLLVPAYTSRARHTVRVGDVVTTEVPGLALALRRPGIALDTELRLTDGVMLGARVVLSDALATLALKARARTVRNEARDAEDLWRCLEIASADGVTPDVVDADPDLAILRRVLVAELGTGGRSLDVLMVGRAEGTAVRLRTRIRALMSEVVGIRA